MQQQVSAKDLRDTIEYVCHVLGHFGLYAPTAEEIRHAKINDDNDSLLCNKFLLVIYELLLLHLGEFKFKFTKVDKDFDEIGTKLSSIKTFIIYYLWNLKCPFLVHSNGRVALKVSSSRDLLLLLGWLMSITNIFEMYNESLFEEVNKFFTKMVVQKQEFDEDLIIPAQQKQTFNNDINDVIAGYKKLKHQFKKLVKLTDYESKQASEAKKTIEAAQCEISFDEYQFLKKKENLYLLGKGFENINRTLDYEIKHVKFREIFWGWLEDAVKIQKKVYINDPDLRFEDEVPIEDLRNPSKSPVVPLQKLTNDMEAILKTYEQVKARFVEFNQIWDVERQKLNRKEFASVYKQFKNEVPFQIKELEEKYPTLESMKNDTQGLGLFFGEIVSHLQSLLNETPEENSVELQKLSHHLLKAKEENDALHQEIHSVLREYYSLLPKDIKVFPA